MSPTFDAVARRGELLLLALKVLSIGLAAVMLAPAAAPLEARIAPVVRDFAVTSVRPGDGHAEIGGVLDQRRSCPLVGVTIYSGDATNRSTLDEALPVGPANGGSKPLLRRTGRHVWGPWRVEAPRIVAGPHIFIEATWRCHQLYTVTQRLAALEFARLYPDGD